VTEPEAILDARSNEHGDDDVISFGHDAAAALDFNSESDEESDDEDESVFKEIQNYHERNIASSSLTMAMQGFRRPPSLQSSTTSDPKPTSQTANVFDPPSIVYRNETYHINRCYRAQLPQTGVHCTVGILRFVNEHTAKCILVTTFEETFLGIGGEGYEIDQTMQNIKVQVSKHTQDLHLSEFRSHSTDGEEMPQLIYEPRKKGSWHTFGYFYDRNKVKKNGKRDTIRSLELFAGAGGSLLGYHDEGFETVMAVEKDPNAVNTLKANNPGLKVYPGCVRKLLEDYDKMNYALGRIDHIHYSSPCQDFSKANRCQTSGRRDRADLTLLLLDFIRKTSCSTAIFENVTGLFDRNNVAYLKVCAILMSIFS
jgi:hypothetical protein